MKFDYKDGTVISDRRILPKIKRKIGLKSKNENKESFTNYVINIKTKEFHLENQKCTKLRNVNLKNIQETTAIKQDLLDKGLKPCEKCMTNNIWTTN